MIVTKMMKTTTDTDDGKMTTYVVTVVGYEW